MTREGNLKKAASACRAFLAQERGFCDGVRQIALLLSCLGKPWPDEFPLFDEFHEATAAFPKFQNRLGWHRESLFEQDLLLARMEMSYRPRLLQEVFRLLDALEETLLKEFPVLSE